MIAAETVADAVEIAVAVVEIAVVTVVDAVAMTVAAAVVIVIVDRAMTVGHAQSVAMTIVHAMMLLAKNVHHVTNQRVAAAMISSSGNLPPATY